MKNLRTALAVGALMFAATSVHADDWDVHQQNYGLSNGDHSVQFRDYVNKDKRHLMYSYKVNSRLKVQYQYWDNKGTIEHRPRFDIRLARLKTDIGNFHITNRNEFRLPEGGDKHIRAWIKFGYDYTWGDNKVKISVNPRYNFEKSGWNQGERSDILTTVSYSRKVNKNWTISPGFWYQLDQNNQKKNLYSTLKISYKF